jgi:hypothetical protein
MGSPGLLVSTITELYKLFILPDSERPGEFADFDDLFIAAISDALEMHSSRNACFRDTGSEFPIAGERGTPTVIGLFIAFFLKGLALVPA